jgi:hypothetical protein
MAKCKEKSYIVTKSEIIEKVKEDFSSYKTLGNVVITRHCRFCLTYFRE